MRNTEKENRVTLVLTCTDRNGRHLATRHVYGQTEEEVRKKETQAQNALMAEHPDCYYFTRLERARTLPSTIMGTGK